MFVGGRAEVKASFEILSAIHVYSIEPSPLSVWFLWLGVCLTVMKADMGMGYRICFSLQITALL